MTKVFVSDALGNEVTIDTDASLAVAERTAARLFDHVKAEPPAGIPEPAGRVVGFRRLDEPS